MTITETAACVNCVFWQRDIGPQAKSRIGMGRCDRLEDTGQVWSEAYEKAGIFTAGDFSCNLFESKEPRS